MGACVAPALGDTVCGLAERAGLEGCSFLSCPAGERLDVASGRCVGVAWLGLAACGEHEQPVVESEQVSCVSPDATCPRFTRRKTEGCIGPPACPPGSLPDHAACRPVVTAGARGHARVDVGAWAALALGIDGGPGSAALCQPFAQRPALFGAAADAPWALDIRVAVRLPDEDVSALSAKVLATAPGGVPLSADAEAFVTRSTTALLELLRGLGGESSAASAEAHVRCEIRAR
jgi:hypothetical protein